MPRAIDVLVGIVYHSGLDRLERCLLSLGDEGFAAVVVLDASPDGHARALVQAHGMTWMDGSRNAGYAWGLQEIFSSHASPYSVFVASNADIEYLPGSLEALATHAQQLRAACYALQLDQSLNVTAYSVATQLTVRSLIANSFGLGRKAQGVSNSAIISKARREAAPVAIPGGHYGSGAVLAMPCDLWRRSGGFSPEYFLYSEDKSLGTRLDAMGIKAYLCGDAPIVHDAGTLARGVRKEALVESLVSEQINWVNQELGPQVFLLTVQVLSLVVKAAAAAVRGRRGSALAYLGALRHRVRFLRLDEAARRGTDGYRLPTLSW